MEFVRLEDFGTVLTLMRETGDCGAILKVKGVQGVICLGTVCANNGLKGVEWGLGFVPSPLPHAAGFSSPSLLLRGSDSLLPSSVFLSLLLTSVDGVLAAATLPPCPVVTRFPSHHSGYPKI